MPHAQIGVVALVAGVGAQAETPSAMGNPPQGG